MLQACIHYSTLDPKKKPKPKAPPQPVVNTNRIKPTTIVIELKPLMQITFSLQVR